MQNYNLWLKSDPWMKKSGRNFKIGLWNNPLKKLSSVENGVEFFTEVSWFLGGYLGM